MVWPARGTLIVKLAIVPRVYVATTNSVGGDLFMVELRWNVSMMESGNPVILLMESAHFRKSMAPEFGWLIKQFGGEILQKKGHRPFFAL